MTLKTLETSGLIPSSTIRTTLELEQQAHTLGFKWENPQQILDQILSETQEVRDVLEHEKGNPKRLAEETGDLLMAVLCFCFFMDMDPEEILDKSNQKFKKRFNRMQQILQIRGLDSFSGMSMIDMLKIWEEAKKD